MSTHLAGRGRTTGTGRSPTRTRRPTSPPSPRSPRRARHRRTGSRHRRRQIPASPAASSGTGCASAPDRGTSGCPCRMLARREVAPLGTGRATPVLQLRAMRVPLTVNDFLRRAELLYPRPHRHRRRARSAGRVVGLADLRRDGPAGPGAGRRARRARHRPRRAGRRSSATTRPGCSPRCSACQRLGARPRADQLPARRRGGRATSSSTPAPACCCVDPELDDALADVECEHRFVIGADADAALMRYDVEPRPWAADEDATATINYTSGHHGPAEGRAADPPQPLAQRHHVRLARSASTTATCTCTRCRSSTATAGAMLYAVTGMGAPAHHPAQDRRRRDPPPRRAARRHADVRRAGGGQRGPRRRAERGTGEIPGPRPRRASSSPAPRRRRARSSASRAELGWEFIQIYGLTETTPLLTMNRGRAEFDDLDARRAGAPS